MTLRGAEEAAWSYVEHLTHREHNRESFHIEPWEHEHEGDDPWHREANYRTCQETYYTLL